MRCILSVRENMKNTCLRLKRNQYTVHMFFLTEYTVYNLLGLLEKLSFFCKIFYNYFLILKLCPFYSRQRRRTAAGMKTTAAAAVNGSGRGKRSSDNKERQ